MGGMDEFNDSSPARHESHLPEARQRFLARVVDHALQDKWRAPDDFLRHFPSNALIESLMDVDDLRVKLLVSATGMHEKIARKKSVASASEDLALALEEGTTDAAAIVTVFPPDDKVTYLDRKKLWEFVVEDEFFRVRAKDDKAAHSRATGRLTFMLECALDEQLVTLQDIADGMTFHEIAASLPVAELQEVVKHALQIARAGAPLTEERLLAVVPLSALAGFVPLDHIFQRVILEKVAVPCGFAAAPAPRSEPSAESAEAASATAPPAAAASRPESPAPPPTSGSSPALLAAAPPGSAPIPPASVPAAERKSEKPQDDARRRIVERLKLIERLPPRYSELSTPVLLSIESMYADLSALTDDEERETCVRDSFPNESHLRAAMLGLIELLDPSINTQDPVIRDADVDGLIKIVLFEERRRGEPVHKGNAQGGLAARRAAARRSAGPPPLPKSVPPPPMPPDEAASSSRRKL